MAIVSTHMGTVATHFFTSAFDHLGHRHRATNVDLSHESDVPKHDLSGGQERALS